MTARAVTAAGSAVTHEPGRCSEHGDRLLSHRAAGMRWPYSSDPRTICYHPDHSLDDRERCLFCGGRLFAEGEIPDHVSVSEARTTCSGRCRVALHRSRRRAHV